MKLIWILLLVIILSAATEFFRRKTLNKILNNIYDAAYRKKDEELFLLHIQSPQAKMLMSDASRELIKLNYYVSTDQKEKALKIISRLRKSRLDKNSRKSFYSVAIGYMCEKQEAHVTELLDELKAKAESSQDQDLILLYLDCQLLVDIYIKKELTKAEALKEIINSEIDNSSKVIYMIRLARLYDLNDKKDLSQQWLKKAESIAEGQARKKVEELLKKGWDEQ